jgi:hypothetical protein
MLRSLTVILFFSACAPSAAGFSCSLRDWSAAGAVMAGS